MPVTDEAGALRLLDLIPDPTADTEAAALEAVELEELDDLLGTLSYRERRVLELRYGLVAEAPKTLDEVGRMFNVTRERIRQIQDQALKKLEAGARSSGSRRTVGDVSVVTPPRPPDRRRPRRSSAGSRSASS